MKVNNYIMNKITEDGFIWLLVTDKAKEIYQSGLFELYKLYDDDSEARIESMDDLNKTLANGMDIGIGAGRSSSTPVPFSKFSTR